MPSVGTPSSSTSREQRGALSPYTLAGPPERMSARGASRRSSAMGTSKRWISQ